MLGVEAARGGGGGGGFDFGSAAALGDVGTVEISSKFRLGLSFELERLVV